MFTSYYLLEERFVEIVCLQCVMSLKKNVSLILYVNCFLISLGKVEVICLLEVVCLRCIIFLRKGFVVMCCFLCIFL